MQDLLRIKLHNYLAVHYPDMLLALREEGKEEVFIREKVEGISGQMEELLGAGTPAYMVEIHCMDVLIESLAPSRYDYIYNILEDEFEARLVAFETHGITLFEIINIIIDCGALLDGFDEDDRQLKSAVLDVVANYFANPETVGYGV